MDQKFENASKSNVFVQYLCDPRVKKTVTMYLVMVAVSTLIIFWLEHASIESAFRTAMVAAIAKTFAANWVSGIFE